MTRFLLPTLGVALVVTLGAMIDAQSQTTTEHPQAISAPLRVYAEGRIEGATPEIELRPRTQGQIVAIVVHEGDFVQRGQVLLRLDDERHRHEIALAQADLQLAQAELVRLENGAREQERKEAFSLYQAKMTELEHAQLAWQRTQQLLSQRAVSQQERDDAWMKLKSCEAQVAAAKARADLLAAPPRVDEVHMANARIAAAQARLRLAQAELDRTQLRAPMAGQVLKINGELGELAGPDTNDPALVIADTSRCRVRAFVEELDAPRVEVGMTATALADGLPGQEFKGRVARLSPRMSHKQVWGDKPGERFDTKTREIWIDLEQGESLVVGLRVDVLIDVITTGDLAQNSAAP